MTDDRDWFAAVDYWVTVIGMSLGVVALLAVLFGMAVAAS